MEPRGAQQENQGVAAEGAEAPDFAGQAEAQRRAGRPEEAERIARSGLAERPDFQPGRVALGLALMDLGRLREARRQLEQVVDAASRPTPSSGAIAPAPPPPALRTHPLGGALGDEEFEAAFDRAETDRDQVIDADRIAVEAMRQVDREEAGVRTEPDSPFTTRTVADLLERQGDAAGASAVRAAVAAREAGSGAPNPPAPQPRSGGRRALHTLERWLANLQRSRA